MCLTVDSIKMGIEGVGPISHRDALIANSPLIVRKRMVVDLGNHGRLVTPYQRLPMKLGVRYDDKKPFDIHGGFYDYSVKIDGGGFHAILSSATPDNCSWLRNTLPGEKLVYGIIPEGTRFFLGVNNDIVAKSIILYEKYRDLVAVHGQPVHRSKVRPVIHYTQRAPK